MASYLNRAEKENVMKAAITKVWLEDNLKEVEEKTPHKKGLITAYKYARTYIEKLLSKMLEGKDEMQIAYTIKDSRKYQYVIMGKQEALRAEAESEKSNEFVHIPRKEQEQLINVVLGNCGMCDCTGDDVKTCKCREVLIALEVEPVDVNSECLYRYGRK